MTVATFIRLTLAELNIASPQHDYAQAGDYTVRLTVEDQFGDSDYFERTLNLQ
jgi:hypothetical protein